MFALSSGDDDPLCSQEFEPLRDGWEVVLQANGEFGDTHFALCQQAEQIQSADIAQSAKDGGCSRRIVQRRELERGELPFVLFVGAFRHGVWGEGVLGEGIAVQVVRHDRDGIPFPVQTDTAATLKQSIT